MRMFKDLSGSNNFSQGKDFDSGQDLVRPHICAMYVCE